MGRPSPERRSRLTFGRSPVRESRTPGSARGGRGNPVPYRYMLKRHLNTDHQLTPEQYRQKWSLPQSYPIVAPDYAKTRSALAKKIGLGRKGPMKASRKAKR